MNDDEWSAVHYQFDESIDLLDAFEQAAIEHLEVSNERTIVIYSHTIFDLEVDTGSLADAQSVSIEVFDVSSDHAAPDDPDPVALTESVIDELTATVRVGWERR